MTASLHLFGFNYGVGAEDTRCDDGPNIFKQSAVYRSLIAKHPYIVWDSSVFDNSNISNKFLRTQEVCKQIAVKIQKSIEKNQRFIVIGGDHSCAIGTWAGASEAFHHQGNVGLIWIDAHMDSHTPETSPSGNIHGMPLAALFGYGHHALAQIIRPTPKLLPQQVCLIGIRSFESGEANLLNRLGVHVFYMKDVKERGLASVFNEALSIVQKNTVAYGISLDLDSIDPSEAPGVGTPAVDGLLTKDLCKELLKASNNPHFIGAEITEFNPYRDKEHKTEKVISDLIASIKKQPSRSRKSSLLTSTKSNGISE